MSWENVSDAVLLRSQGLTAGLGLAVVLLSVPLWRRVTRQSGGELPALGTATFAAIVAGRLVWLVTTARPQLTNPIDLVRANTGIDMLSAAWVFALTSVWLGRRHHSALPQYAGWTILLAPAVHAAGCLLRRDCAGRTAPAPFGMTFSGYSELRLPIGLYEALALGVALAVLVRFRTHLLTSPYIALTLLGVIQWAVEFGRIGQLTRATFGIRLMWLASSAVALLFVLVAARTRAGSRRLLRSVVQSRNDQG